MSIIAEPLQKVLSAGGTVLTVIALIFYLLQCFFGYRLMRVSVAVIGFFVGFVIGVRVSGNLLTGHTAAIIIIGVVIGILLGFCAYRIYLAGVFILCFYISASAIWNISFPDGTGWKVLHIVLAIAAGITVGALCVVNSRTFIILATGIFGAVNSVSNIVKLSPDFFAGHNISVYAAMAVLAAVGILVQFLSTRNMK